jgi:hypothetical protein
MPRTLIAAGLLLLATACAQLPRVELQAYRDSFTAAQTAATSINADYAVAERTARVFAMQHAPVRAADGTVAKDDHDVAIPRYTRANPYYQDFELNDAAGVSTIGLPPGAAAVDRGFRAIAAYNDTLVALAENRNIAEAKGQLRQIISDVGGIVPVDPGVVAIASSVSDIVAQILTPAIEIDNRAQFRDKILEGYEPMRHLVGLLRTHSMSQYRAIIDPLVRRAENLADQDPARAALVDRINAWHHVFADYVVLLNAVDERLTVLKSAVEHPRETGVLARASAGAGELRGYAEGLRHSIDQLRALP